MSLSNIVGDFLDTVKMPCHHSSTWRDQSGPDCWVPMQRTLLKSSSETATATQAILQISPGSIASIAKHGGGAYVCLACGSVGSRTHLEAHTCTSSVPAPLLDLDRKELFCPRCHDYVYDTDFDEAMLGVHAAKLKNKGTLGSEHVSAVTPRARAGIPAITLPVAWNSGAIHNIKGASPVPPGKEGLPLGLRGINNLGNTCFMSSVLQAMLHAPLLRAYFLGAGHSREVCPVSAEGTPCIGCGLDKSFGEHYSQAIHATSPSDLLYAWWNYADHLAGYQQHDAHEFYLTALSALDGSGDGVRGMLHRHFGSSEDDDENFGREGSRDESVAESVFGGILRSDVTCQGCGNTSTAYDPFMDVSLDLQPVARTLPRPANTAGPASTASDIHGPRMSGVDSEANGPEAGPQASSRFRPAMRGGRSGLRGRGRGRKRSHLQIGHRPEASPPPVNLPSPDAMERHDSWQHLPAEDTPQGTEDSHSLVYSDVDAGSSVVGDAADLMGETATSPAPQPFQAHAPGPGRPRGRAPMGPGRGGRIRRCGECHHCLNRHLKKACLGNVLFQQQQQQQQLEHQRPPAGSTLSAGGTSEGRAVSKGIVSVGGDQIAPGAVPASLLGCLHSFMRTETLGAGEHWVCGRCKSQQQATKQMSIRRLPPVLCLHIKRFEHRGLHKRKAARKIDTPLVFPIDTLDMSDFTSSAVLRERFCARSGSTQLSPEHQPNYELYAVVSHRGNMEGGHYITYLKVDGKWYLMDDAWVVAVDVEVVKRCQAYMLFYKRKTS